MSKVMIQVDDLKALRKIARANDALEHWGDVAEQWAEGANAEVARLTADRDAALALLRKSRAAVQVLAEAVNGAYWRDVRAEIDSFLEDSQ